MQAHANDLRSEIANDWELLFGDEPRPADESALDERVHAVVDDWRACPFTPAARVLLEFVEKVTRTPARMCEQDVQRLREAGYSDRAIHDAVQAAAYFAYINRVADALGVRSEPGLPTWGRARPGDHGQTVSP